MKHPGGEQKSPRWRSSGYRWDARRVHASPLAEEEHASSPAPAAAAPARAARGAAVLAADQHAGSPAAGDAKKRRRYNGGCQIQGCVGKLELAYHQVSSQTSRGVGCRIITPARRDCSPCTIATGQVAHRRPCSSTSSTDAPPPPPPPPPSSRWSSSSSSRSSGNPRLHKCSSRGRRRSAALPAGWASPTSRASCRRRRTRRAARRPQRSLHRRGVSWTGLCCWTRPWGSGAPSLSAAGPPRCWQACSPRRGVTRTWGVLRRRHGRRPRSCRRRRTACRTTTAALARACPCRGSRRRRLLAWRCGRTGQVRCGRGGPGFASLPARQAALPLPSLGVHAVVALLTPAPLPTPAAARPAHPCASPLPPAALPIPAPLPTPRRRPPCPPPL